MHVPSPTVRHRDCVSGDSIRNRNITTKDMHRITLSRPPSFSPTPSRRRRPFGRTRLLAVLLAFALLTSCVSPQVTGKDITIRIDADGATHNVTVPSGTTVTQALQSAGVIVGDLDKVDPPLYTVLADGNSVTLTRVQEIFETEEQIIPFERQVVRNESLPEGETRLVQAGVNGQQELTYRRVLENDVEISRSVVKTVTLQDALPEIVMVGAQSSFAPLPIPGKLAERHVPDLHS
jgi:hypothetical protein